VQSELERRRHKATNEFSRKSEGKGKAKGWRVEGEEKGKHN